MKYHFSKHAAEQMTDRGISKTAVEEILKNPLEVVFTDKNRIYQGILSEKIKKLPNPYIRE